MSKLKCVKPSEAKTKKPMILIYGAAGVRKTWESIRFPKAFLSDSEGGATNDAYKKRLAEAGGEYFGLEQGAGSFDEVIDQVKALATVKHHFLTFVLDSLSKIYNTEITKEMERLGDKDAFGASKKPAINKTRKLLNWLDKLDMTRVLICHERVLWKDDKQAGTTFDGYDKLAYELDLVLCIAKQGTSYKAHVKKSRLPGFSDADIFDWSYEEFSKRFGKEIMEHEATPIQMITMVQLTELKVLLETVKVEEKTVESWLTAAKVDSFEELDFEKAEKIITFLKSKLTLANTEPKQ